MKPFETSARRAVLLVPEVSKVLILSVILLIPVGGTFAVAQSATDVFNLFTTIMRSAVTERVEGEWRKLPHYTLVCIEQGLQQQGQSTRHLIEKGITPGDPRLSGLRVACGSPAASSLQVKPVRLPLPERESVERQDVSATPTFDCTRAVSPTAAVICLDQEGAKADWDLISAYWARSFSLVGNARERFQQAHNEWFPALSRSCGLQTGQSYFSAGQRQCVLTAYRKRSQSYRSQLSGDALAESRLSPDQHVAMMWKPEHRLAADRRGLRYPSDLTDAEWGIVAPMIPPGRHGGRRRSVNVREVLNGIFYVLWTGCQWKALPKDLPPKSTVHDYLELWNWDGTLERIHHALYVAVREEEGHEASPTVAIINSQTAKGAQKGGLGLILRATTRARRSRVASGTSWSTRWVSC